MAQVVAGPSIVADDRRAAISPNVLPAVLPTRPEGVLMNRTQYRMLSILATGAAALTLGATPALAGSDGCDEDGCQDENAPAQVVPAPPTAEAPSPLQAPAPSVEGGSSQPEESSTSSPQRVKGSQRTVANRTGTNRTVAHRTGTNRTVAQRTIPQGAVQAGAGGTAPQGPDGALFGVAGAGLVLLAAGGRLLAAGRDSMS
jgi:hypothetical protein